MSILTDLIRIGQKHPYLLGAVVCTTAAIFIVGCIWWPVLSELFKNQEQEENRS